MESEPRGESSGNGVDNTDTTDQDEDAINENRRRATMEAVEDRDILFSEGDEDIEEVNNRFNKRLDELDKDRNQKGRVLYLGYPGTFLLYGGIAYGEIVMDFDKFIRKSSANYDNNHPFTARDIKDLPKAINAPIAVIDSTSNKDKAILTELKKDGLNNIVAIRATSRQRKGGVSLEINEITTLYPKNAKGIVTWFIDGRHTQIDKEKALRWIEALRPHVGTSISEERNSESALAFLSYQSAPIAATAAKAELNSAAKVIENFENPSINNEKMQMRKNFLLIMYYSVMSMMQSAKRGLIVSR